MWMSVIVSYALLKYCSYFDLATELSMHTLTLSSADKHGLLPANLININYSRITDSECRSSFPACGFISLFKSYSHQSDSSCQSCKPFLFTESRTTFLIEYPAGPNWLLHLFSLVEGRLVAKCPVELTFFCRWLMRACCAESADDHHNTWLKLGEIRKWFY